MKKDMPEGCAGCCRTYLKIWMWNTSDEEEMKSDDSNIIDTIPATFSFFNWVKDVCRVEWCLDAQAEL